MKKGFLRTVSVAALSATVLMTGCSDIDKDATVVTIKSGDTEDTISLGYANFVARYQQSMYDQFLLSYYGENMWSQDMTGTGSTMESETKNSVMKDLKSQYAAKQHAADYGVALSDEQKTEISEAAKKFMTDNPEDTIEVLGATEEYVQKYLEDRTLYKLVADAVKEEAKAGISEDEYWMRSFQYVTFTFNGTDPSTGEAVEYSEEELAEFKEQAESISKAEDFDAKVEELGLNAQSYSYLKGEETDSTLDMSIIEAAEALAEGETSAVIEVEGTGYFVIKLTADHDEDASNNKLDSLTDEVFENKVSEWTDEFEWTVDDEQWDKVVFDTLFKALEKPAEETTEESTEETTEETTEESTEDETETSEDETTDTSDEASDAN